MTETTRQLQSTLSASVAAGGAVVLLAFELGARTWKLALTTDLGQRIRHKTVPAGDVTAVLTWVAQTRQRLEVPAQAPVITCYEAGRDGFWLHRALAAQAVRNLVVDAASIEVPRRQRHAKTDRLDAQRLVLLLVRWVRGERDAVKVVHVPTDAAEDARELHRELESVKRARTAVSNRITGLLAKHGIRVQTVTAHGPEDVGRLRRWDGSPLPDGVRGRILRDGEEYDTLTRRIAVLEAERDRQIRDADTPAAAQVRQLLQLRAIGANSAWLFVHEFFAWRTFRNRREVGALAGLTGTPHASGAQAHELGISRAGNARVRTMLMEIAWGWLRFQPESALTRWYRQRYARGSRRQRRIGIVALARKLLIELWRYLETGALPEGAQVKPV